MKYQDHYSQINPRMFAFQDRQEKALKVMAILTDFINQSQPLSLKDLICLEIGCAAGGMTKIFAKSFKEIVGIDIDKKAIKIAQKENRLRNIDYQAADVLNLPFPDNQFDVVICNHVYEHVPDPFKMMAEIYRLLKKGGICYFAAGNKYILIEGHYHLPFLSWLPKPFANFYFRLAGQGNYYYETHFSYWQLKKLVKDFQIHDYTLKVIKEPAKFLATHPYKEILARIPVWLLKILLPTIPTYFWVLKKTKLT